MVDIVFFTIALVNSATAFATFSVAFFPIMGSSVTAEIARRSWLGGRISDSFRLSCQMRSHTLAYRSHSFSVTGLSHNISTASRAVRAPRTPPGLMMRPAVAADSVLLRKKENIGAHTWDAYRIHR